MSLFELGEVLMTAGVAYLVKDDPQAASEVAECLGRHALGDWGDLCDEDREMNDDAIEAERSGGYTDRLFSVYKTSIGKIYIITEHDRSATTILLPNEY